MSLEIAGSDSGPIHYLALIDEIAILSQLFSKVLIPDQVQQELLHPNAPEKVRALILNSPSWLEIQSVGSLRPIRGLHLGETAALGLAASQNANALLMDDTAGRKAARLLHLNVVGTVALLERGAEKNFSIYPLPLRSCEAPIFTSPKTSSMRLCAGMMSGGVRFRT